MWQICPRFVLFLGAFNRTILELKYTISQKYLTLSFPFNRTILELKLEKRQI